MISTTAGRHTARTPAVSVPAIATEDHGRTGRPYDTDQEHTGRGDRDDEHAEDLIAVATTFMAHQPGAAQRALARHTPLPDGRCSGCPHPTTRWPCFVAAIALRVESITRRGPSATQELGP